MTTKIQVLAIVFSCLLALAVLGLTRRKLIRIKYTLVWLLMCLAFFILSLCGNLFFVLADLIGVYSPVNAVFIVAFICILLMLFNFSVIISRLSYANRRLTLKLGLLIWRIEQMEKQK
ncbi:MAG: DUF2304 domain-containing protein [Thermodesulfobacteriota bacterium]